MTCSANPFRPAYVRLRQILLAACFLMSVSAGHGQSTAIALAPTSIPAGSPGFAIAGNLPADTSSSPDVNFCFYTGYGSAAPVVPGAFSSSASGAAFAFTVPSSTIQQIPPSAFSNGNFKALVYAVPLSATSCTGSPQATAAGAVPVSIEYPVLNSLSIASAAAQNLNLTTRLPLNLELVGANFILQSAVTFTASSSTIPASAALINPNSIVSLIPASISTASIVTATVCNTAVYSYCTASLPLHITALMPTVGSVTVNPPLSSPSQLVALNSTFGSAAPNVDGVPSGLVTFADGGTNLGSAPLLLDTTASFVQAPTASFTTDSVPVQSIVVDLNQDGIPDLLFIEPNATTNGSVSPVIHALLGTTPAGQFALDRHYMGLKDLPCTTLLSTAVANFTGDGYPDIAILCSNPSASGPPAEVLYTLFNMKNGALVGTIIAYSPLFGDHIAAADFNKDGNSDIVVSGAVDAAGDTGFQVLLGNGDGSFRAGPVTTGLDTARSPSFGDFHIAAADFHNEGAPDIAILNGASSSGSVDNLIQVFQNDGTGQFTLKTTVPTDGTNTAHFFASRLAPGTPPSLIIASASASSPGISVAVNQSATDIAFSSALQFTPIPGMTDAVVGDFNGDGLIDVAVTDASTTHVLTGNGAGVFTATYPSLSFVPPTGSNLLSTADENGDGYADLLATVTTPGASGASTTTVYDYITAGTASASLAGVNLAADGAHLITASTPGTVELAGASAQATANITGSAPALTIAASASSPISYGTPFALNATFADPSATGTISFYNSNVLLGTAALKSTGTYAFASFTPPTLAAASYSFTAVYGGDSTEASATSAPLSFIVAPIPATISWNPSPGSISYGVPLAATQLDALATGLAGASLAGTFTYTPTLGSILKTGPEPLSVTFTPSSTNYIATTASSSIIVTQAVTKLAWTPNPAAIVYGTALSAAQLDASAFTLNTASVPGTYTYTPALGAVLATGTHPLSVMFTPTDTADFSSASASSSIVVSQAAPVITWPVPPDVIVDTVLSSTQLDATAATPQGAALPGTFVYTPPSGTLLSVAGAQILSLVFTPTDTTNFTTATASVSLNIGPIGIGSIVPSSALLGDAAKTVTVTGTGFSTTSVVEMNGVAVPTSYSSSTSLTAIVPAADFLTVQILQLSVYDPTKNLPSNAVPFTVTAPSTSVAVSAPTSISPGSQTTVIFHLSPYPAPVTASLTLAFGPANSLPDDPGIVFVESGLRTYSVTVPAHAAELDLPVTFQSGTIEGTLTLVLNLDAGGANVTPASIQPIVISEPVAVPGISSITLQPDGDTLTVITRGFSNDRKITGAAFHFTASSGNTISTPDLTIDVTPLFSSWYANPESDQYGSLFTYTEVFNLSTNASTIGQVSVILTNDVGTSQEANTP